MTVTKIKFGNLEVAVTSSDPDYLLQLAESLNKRAAEMEASLKNQPCTDIKLLLLVALNLQHEVENLAKERTLEEERAVTELMKVEENFTETINSVASYMESIAEQIKV